jgi:serine/threonine protein kinase
MIGTSLGKTYQVIDKIDEGGMGVVYQVEHQTLHKRFAAKVLSSQLAENAEARRRFEIEAHAASKLDHENIVNVTDYGVADDGRPYLVMELLKGKTLHQRMSEGPLSLQEVIGVIVPVCRALEAAHAEGFIHRDVKPENIFLTQRPAGRFGIKVLDFGITRFRAETSRLTKLGSALGSPLYMAPEACRGEPIDSRVDIYSVGVLLYQLICGELPFYDENLLRVIQLQVSQPLVPPRSLRPDIPEQLDLVIRTALEKDPDARYQTIEQLEDDLLASLPPGADELLHARRTPLTSPIYTSTPLPIQVGSPSSSGSLSPVSGAQPVSTTLSTRRSRLPMILVALLLGGGAAGAFVFLRGKKDGGEKVAAPAGAPDRAPPAAADRAGTDDTLPPTPGSPTRRVELRTTPDGARVELDGTFLGNTPLDIEVPVADKAGVLAISARGYSKVERRVAGDKDIVLNLELEQVRRAAQKQPPPRKKPPAVKPPAASQPDDELDIRGAR